MAEVKNQLGGTKSDYQRAGTAENPTWRLPEVEEEQGLGPTLNLALPQLADFQPQGELARGTYGRVDRYSGPGGDVAVKEALEGGADELAREKEVLGQLAPHENIVGKGATTEPGDDRLALEMLSGGNGEDMIEKLRDAYKNDVISHTEFWGAIQTMTSDSAAGLQHMHESGLVHRDFKPKNLMFDEGGVGKLVDFGSTADVGAEYPGYVGSSLENLSPEAMKVTAGVVPNAARTEMDSIGLANMVHKAGEGSYATDALKEYNQASQMFSIMNAQGPLVTGQPGAYGNFMSALSAADPDERVTAEQARELPFLADPLLEVEEGRAVLSRMKDYEMRPVKDEPTGGEPTAAELTPEERQEKVRQAHEKAQREQDERLKKYRVQNKRDKLSTKDAVHVARRGQRHARGEKKGRKSLLSQIGKFDKKNLRHVGD